MDYEKISQKIKSSEHTEFDQKHYTDVEKIKYRVENLLDPFDRNYKFKKKKINDEFPKEIFDNQEKYKDWILK